MALKKNGNKNEEKKNTFELHSLEVLRAKELEASGAVSTNVAFDMEVNGIKIYGCYYKEGVKDGKQWSLISLPQRKNEKDGEYYSIVWFPISKELTDKICAQLSNLL